MNYEKAAEEYAEPISHSQHAKRHFLAGATHADSIARKEGWNEALEEMEERIQVLEWTGKDSLANIKSEIAKLKKI